MPSLPRVQTCCCCCSTEAGTKIIAWLLAIFGALGTIVYIVELIQGSIISGVAANILQLILTAVTCLLGVYLLIGVYRGNDDVVRVWISVYIVYIAIEVILVIAGIILMIIGKLGADGSVNIFSLILHSYFVIVVSSYRKERATDGM